MNPVSIIFFIDLSMVDSVAGWLSNSAPLNV